MDKSVKPYEILYSGTDKINIPYDVEYDSLNDLFRGWERLMIPNIVSDKDDAQHTASTTYPDWFFCASSSVINSKWDLSLSWRHSNGTLGCEVDKIAINERIIVILYWNCLYLDTFSSSLVSSSTTIYSMGVIYTLSSKVLAMLPEFFCRMSRECHSPLSMCHSKPLLYS